MIITVAILRISWRSIDSESSVAYLSQVRCTLGILGLIIDSAPLCRSSPSRAPLVKGIVLRNVWKRTAVPHIASHDVQLKKVLSSIPETVLNVECLMNDVDVSSRMTRELFEEKSASILERVKLPLQQVGLTIGCIRT